MGQKQCAYNDIISNTQYMSIHVYIYSYTKCIYYVHTIIINCNYTFLIACQVEMLSRNIDEIENKLEEIEQVQNDIITKPAASSKCMICNKL